MRFFKLKIAVFAAFFSTRLNRTMILKAKFGAALRQISHVH